VKLEDAIFLVGQMSENAVVCAKTPFFLGTDALITELTPEYAVPTEVLSAGFTYFLEKDGIVELLEMIEPKAVSRETQAEFVIHYATLDAYPAWFNDLPGKSSRPA
jgi:hypothetical protein